MALPDEQHGVVVSWTLDVELDAQDRKKLRELSKAVFDEFTEEPGSAAMRRPSDPHHVAVPNK